MASPMLEAGAIDGARGILINITGSSSLKLSEVNEASSLIQTAAHEDANIIFGAVLNEDMGEEVKITVIATGFRDQMPERRARMLTVDEAPAAEEEAAEAALASDAVPVENADRWLEEQAVPAEPPTPKAPFLSESLPEAPAAEEEAAEAALASDAVPVENADRWLEEQAVPAEPPTPKAPFLSESLPEAPAVQPPAAPAEDPFFFSSAEPPVATTVTVDEPAELPPDSAEVESSSEEFSLRPSNVPLPDVSAPSTFSDSGSDDTRDLDVPAFMRRLQF